MTAVLVTFGKSGERKEFSLEGKSTIIGRKTDADLRIPISEISRAHCEFTMNGKGVVIRDLGSSNGTYVNDQRIDDDVVLSAGDRVRVGPVIFMLQIDGTPARITPAQLAPPAKAEPAGPAKKAPADAATIVAPKSPGDTDEIEDLDIDALDDLDVDDLSDIDLSDEGSGALDELDELDEDDLIEDDEDEQPRKKK